jgi:hypothetical protein
MNANGERLHQAKRPQQANRESLPGPSSLRDLRKGKGKPILSLSDVLWGELLASDRNVSRRKRLVICAYKHAARNC